MGLQNMCGKSKEEYEQIPGIPPHMGEGLYMYVEHGILPGSFLTAVLCNDLKQSFQCADHINRACLETWAQIMTWCVPGVCQGSPEIVKEYKAKKQMEREEKKNG